MHYHFVLNMLYVSFLIQGGRKFIFRLQHWVCCVSCCEWGVLWPSFSSCAAFMGPGMLYICMWKWFIQHGCNTLAGGHGAGFNRGAWLWGSEVYGWQGVKSAHAAWQIQGIEYRGMSGSRCAIVIVVLFCGRPCNTFPSTLVLPVWWTFTELVNRRPITTMARCCN